MKSMITPAIANQLLRLPRQLNCVLLQHRVSGVQAAYRREKAIIPYLSPGQERPVVGSVTTIEGVECLVASVHEETYNIIVEAWIQSGPVPTLEALAEACSMTRVVVESWMEGGVQMRPLESHARSAGC